jgi:hypothetical protein
MSNILSTGLILIVIGAVGYVSWTRPKRSYPPKDYALATIRVSQAAIGIGLALILIALARTVIQRLF